MLHQQLVAAVEKFRERAPALACVKDVMLVDAHPGQRAPFASEPVAQARQLLFVRQQRLPLGNPFVPGYDGMVGGHLGRGRSAGCLCFHHFGSFGYLFALRSSITETQVGPASVHMGVTSVSGFGWTR